MKYALFLLLFITASFAIDAQSLSDHQDQSKSFWMSFKDIDIKSDLPDVVRDLYGLNDNHHFNIKREEVDKLGMKHIRLTQYYHDIPVYGIQSILHFDQEMLKSSNGRLARNFDDQSMSNLISEGRAMDIAKNITPSTIMAYEHESFKNSRPSAELMWFPAHNKAGESEYTLAYRVDIYSIKPLFRYNYFIDAQSGKELSRVSTLVQETVPRTTETEYFGEREILVDSIAPQEFRLYDDVRHVHTTTIDIDRMNEEDVFNGDSTWRISQHVYGELDAHWGAEMTYDYLQNVLGRNSVDNQGLTLESKIIREFGVENAFWTGEFSLFGAGNGGGVRPFSVLDVVGHEFTHGVVEFTAGLIYQAESGALNESFADIFGKAVEFHTVPGEFTWELGAGIRGEGVGIRNIEDTKKYNDPNYYRGEFWADINSGVDNGGVHTNSGVQNFWFYLLCVGQTDMNERGVMYDVVALGLEKAEQIAYRNLAYYLTPSSSYEDAVEGSIQAAIDLYGSCSMEHRMVIEAWRAVGLWSTSLDEDNYSLEVIRGVETACGISEVNISTVLRRLHCNNVPDPSDVEVYVRVDGSPVTQVNSSLTDLQNFGDEIEIAFTDAIDVSTVGVHTVEVYIESVDENARDDTLRVTFENLLQQNADFLTMSATNVSSSCDLASSPLTGIFVFNGCDSIEAGASLNISYILNDLEATRTTESYVLPATLYPDDTFEFTFSNLSHVEMEGAYDISMDVDYPTDPFLENNIAQVAHVYHTRSINSTEDFPFLRPEIDEEYSYLKVGESSAWDIINGPRHLRLSGGSPYNPDSGEFEPTFPESEEEMWNDNQDYKNEYCFCIDAQEWTGGAMISFDRSVIRSSVHDSMGVDQDIIQYASALRLVANGTTQEMPTIYGNTWPSDSTILYMRDTVILSNFGNQYFDLCFESHHFVYNSDLFDADADATHLDNITIEEYIVLATEEEVQFSKQVNIYPNPASEFLLVDLPDQLRVNNYEIISIDGRIIRRGNFESTIDLAGLPAGYYMLELITDQNLRLNKPFVKTKN